MGESLDFSDVFSIVRGHLNPGRLKLNKTGIVFKSVKTGVLETIPLAELEETRWMRVARGFGIKVTTKNGTEHRFHGFKDGDGDKLKVRALFAGCRWWRGFCHEIQGFSSSSKVLRR